LKQAFALTWNSQSSCHSLWNAGIIDVDHHAQFTKSFSNLGIQSQISWGCGKVGSRKGMSIWVFCHPKHYLLVNMFVEMKAKWYLSTVLTCDWEMCIQPIESAKIARRFS
jgi:hypothetical protein